MIAAFLQITAVITVTPVFLWVAFAIAIVYLGVLTLATTPARRTEQCGCRCTTLNTLLVGILGTTATAAILLAVGIVATSVISAILIGLLVLFFVLTITSTACFIRCSADCSN